MPSTASPTCGSNAGWKRAAPATPMRSSPTMVRSSLPSSGAPGATISTRSSPTPSPGRGIWRTAAPVRKKGAMQLSNQEAERLVREGVDALRAGRPAEARDRFRSVTETGRANAQIWMLLATACRAASDWAGEEAAVDQLLELEPQAIRGLIVKGDCRARDGDVRGAARLYKMAMRFAEGQALPQDLRAELARAEDAARDLEKGYGRHLEASLAARGFAAGARSPRFQQSLDI